MLYDAIDPRVRTFLEGVDMSARNATTAEIKSCLRRMRKTIRAHGPEEIASEKLDAISHAITSMGTDDRPVEQMSEVELKEALHAFDIAALPARMPLAKLVALGNERRRLITAISWTIGRRIGSAEDLEGQPPGFVPAYASLTIPHDSEDHRPNRLPKVSVAVDRPIAVKPDRLVRSIDHGLRWLRQ